MPAPDDEQQTIEWGHVGDVCAVIRLLSQALELVAEMTSATATWSGS